MPRKQLRKYLLIAFSLLFLAMNIVAFFHAYKFTHFSHSLTKTKSPEKLTTTGRLKALLLGIDNPKPVNTSLPAHPYKTIELQSHGKISCWYISTDSIARGTVIVFHGYSGDKSSMLDKAEEFLSLGYNTLLVDFRGCGASEGVATTIGYKEAEDVKTAFSYVASLHEPNIYLFGTSMGAAAILKAINDYQLAPRGMIIECPFGSMYRTVCARFSQMHLPSLPMAPLLVFWGGVQNGFWAFCHNPTGYARSVTCPALLMYGERDRNVSREETDEIFSNMRGPKMIKLFADAGHENYLIHYHDEWVRTVSDFLQSF